MPDSDYLRTTGFVGFDTGEQFREVNISIVDDAVLEAMETFSATLISLEHNVVVQDFSDRADISITDNDREYLVFVATLENPAECLSEYELS